MRLPVIKALHEFIKNNDEDYLLEAIEVLEHIGTARGIKEDEQEVIGELLSNMFGAIEVEKMVKDGKSQKEALNAFMERVTGVIS